MKYLCESPVILAVDVNHATVSARVQESGNGLSFTHLQAFKIDPACRDRLICPDIGDPDIAPFGGRGTGRPAPSAVGAAHRRLLTLDSSPTVMRENVRMNRKTLVLPAVVGLLAPVLAACGSTDSGAGGGNAIVVGTTDQFVATEETPLLSTRPSGTRQASGTSCGRPCRP